MKNAIIAGLITYIYAGHCVSNNPLIMAGVFILSFVMMAEVDELRGR